MGLAILYQVNPDLGRGVRLFRPSSMMGPEGEERSAPRSPLRPVGFFCLKLWSSFINDIEWCLRGTPELGESGGLNHVTNSRFSCLRPQTHSQLLRP
jgi:hypothetical protein